MDACPLLITSIVAVKPEDQGTFFQDFLGLSGYLCSIGGFYSNTALLRTRNAQNHNEAQRLALAVGGLITCPFVPCVPANPLHAVLGAYCLSQFTHKRTLPKNANQMKNTTKPNLFSCQRDHQGLHIRHEYPHPPSARLACPTNRREPERKGRFQVFFGGKFCYQFYCVMKMENLITTPQAKWLLNGTSAPRCHPCPG